MVWRYFYASEMSLSFWFLFLGGFACGTYTIYIKRYSITVQYTTFWERFRVIFWLKERGLLPLSRFYFPLLSMKVLQENELATYCYWNIIYCLRKSCIVSILSLSNPNTLFVSKYLTYHWPRSIRLSLDFSLLDEREEQTISS